MTLSQVPGVCEAVETWLGNVLSGSVGPLDVGEAASRERHAAVTRGLLRCGNFSKYTRGREGTMADL